MADMLPDVRCLTDVEARPVRWLWHPYIPLEHVTLIYGDGDVRKSWLALAIGAAVTTGAKVCPEDEQAQERGGVLLCTCEDDPAATVRPRADGLGANISRFFVNYGMLQLQGADFARLEETIARHHVKLVILDPVVGMMAATNINNAGSVRGVMAELDALAKRQGCAVIMVHHISKGLGGARQRALGSVDFMNACRSAILVGLDPNAEDKDSVMVHMKHNLNPLGPGPSLAYRTLPGHKLEWIGPTSLSGDEVLGNEGRTSALREAELWLQELLADGGKPVTEIVVAATEAGIAERTLRRARERICQRPRRLDDHWIWELALSKNGH
jgi:DNA repair protein RadA/Sms